MSSDSHFTLFVLLVVVVVVVERAACVSGYVIPNQGGFGYAQQYQQFLPQGQGSPWNNNGFPPPAVNQQGPPLFLQQSPPPQIPYYPPPPLPSNSLAPLSPPSDEPLSFSHPILYINRNIPVFESVEVTNRVDPDFKSENYGSKLPLPPQNTAPRSVAPQQQGSYFQYHQPPLPWSNNNNYYNNNPPPPPPQMQAAATPSFQTSSYSYSTSSSNVMLNPAKFQYWGGGPPQQPSGSAGPSVVPMMMTQYNTGGGVMFANPRFTPGGGGPSSSLSSPSSPSFIPISNVGGSLPSFRSIRKAPPGSFFISVRRPDGSMTYAAEPGPRLGPEPMWSTDPKYTVGAIVQPPPVSPPSLKTASVSKNARNNSQNDLVKRWEEIPVPGFSGFNKPGRTGRGQKKYNNTDNYYPFPPPPMTTYYYPSPSPSQRYIDNNDLAILDQLATTTAAAHKRQQNNAALPSWVIPPPTNFMPLSPLVTNSIIIPDPRPSPLVRQSNYSSSPMQINPPSSASMEQLFSQGRDNTKSKQRMSRRGGGDENDSTNNTRTARWVQLPQSPSTLGSFQPTPLQNPAKQQQQQLPGWFGPPTYPFNDQNGQFQPRSQQQFVAPQTPQTAAGFDPQGGPQVQGYSHSWSSGSSFGGPQQQQQSKTTQFRNPFASRGRAESGFTNSPVTNSPRPEEQGVAGYGPVSRVDQRSGAWPADNGPRQPGEQSWQQQPQQKQYQTWKAGVANPYQQTEPIDYPKESKTPFLFGSGGEVQIYPKSSSTPKYDARLFGVNDTKEDHKFASDSTILQRHLQQAKQVLREQKSREDAIRKSKSTTSIPKSGAGSRGRHHHHHHEHKQQQQSTNSSLLPGSESVPPNFAAAAAVFQPKLPSATAPRTHWDVGNDAVSSATAARNSGPAPTYAATGYQQLSPQQQQFGGQYVPTYADFPPNFPEHGRLGRHAESIADFTSAEDLLAMDLEPLGLEDDLMIK